MTLLEMMIVLAIIALLAYLAGGAIRWLRGANAVETTVDLTQVLNRTSQLAVETGELHRVVIDLDEQTYRIEICEGGATAISKTPEVKKPDPAGDHKAAVERAKQKMSSVPQSALPTGGDADRADEMALALAGDMASVRQCAVTSELFGDPDGKGVVRPVDTSRSAKIKEVWVQHLPDPVTTGLVAIYFFPIGSAEKSIIDITDDSGKSFDILVHGVTGRVEIHDGALDEPDDYMMRDVTGEKVSQPVKRRGFTLVEVMVALAIMALGLAMLLRATANTVHKAESARMESAATVLARGKMYDVEEKLRKDGFTAAGNAGTDDNGTFEEDGWPQISWKVEVREINLPSPEQLAGMEKQQEQSAMAAAAGSGSGSGTDTGTDSGGGASGLFGMLSMFGGSMGGGGGSGMSADSANGAGFLSSGGFGIVQQVFKESIRKVVLTLEWTALGRADSLKVVEYVTDPDAMNRVIGGLGGADADAYEGSGSGTATGTGTASSSSTTKRPGGFGK